MAAVAPSAFGLHPPQSDDTMEISSNFSGDMDGDIDIDLDSAGEQMQYDEDDQMIDDAKPDNMQYQDHVDEDVMLDDDDDDDDAATNPEDRVMQDSPPHQEHDEELLDFSDNEDMPIEDTQHTATGQVLPDTQSQSFDSLEQVQSDAAAELLAEGVDSTDHSANTVQIDLQEAPPEQHELDVDLAAVQPSGHDALEDHSEDDDAQHNLIASETHASQTEELAQEKHDQVPSQSPSQHHVSQVVEDVHPHTDVSAEQPAVQTNDTNELQEEPVNDGLAVTNVVAALEESQPEDFHTSHPASLHVNTDLSKVDEVDDVTSREKQPNSPTVTGLHPTIVEYDGNEIFLFPSREPASFEQYLLENENLVTSSLGDLLQACRVVLGESISEDDELVLGVEELDLYVSEDSTPAFSTSFSELLDVYVKLHQHDGNDHPPAFRVTLTTKTRFTNRLTTINQAIAEGKGFSQLAFLQAYSEFEGITDLPDPDEDFDDENYLDVDQNRSHVAEQQEENDATRYGVDDSNVNERLVQEEGFDVAVTSDKAQSGDHEGVDPTDVGDYQQGEYEEVATVEEADYANEAHHEHDNGQAEGLEEAQTHALDAEGDHHNEGGETDDQIQQQETAEEQSNVVTKSAADFDAQSNVQLQSAPLDDSITGQVAQTEDLSTGAAEEAAHQEYEENLFDDEVEDSHDNTGHAYAVPEIIAPLNNSNAGMNDADTRAGPTGPSQQEDNSGSGNYDPGLEKDSAGDTSTTSQPLPEVAEDVKEDSTTLDNSTGDGDDFDEIDFDDEDYLDEHTPATTSVDTETAKLSPPGKRSFSDRATEGDIDEDGQALKRIRSS